MCAGASIKHAQRNGAGASIQSSHWGGARGLTIGVTHMSDQLSDVVIMGAMLAKAEIGVRISDDSDRIAYANEGCMRILRTDPERRRIETALNHAAHSAPSVVPRDGDAAVDPTRLATDGVVTLL